jgi:hypothetical protein
VSSPRASPLGLEAQTTVVEPQQLGMPESGSSQAVSTVLAPLAEMSTMLGLLVALSTVFGALAAMSTMLGQLAPMTARHPSRDRCHQRTRHSYGWTPSRFSNRKGT